MTEKEKTGGPENPAAQASSTPSVWEVLPRETQEKIHQTAVELAKSVPDLEHYKRGLKEYLREGFVLDAFVKPDLVHEILNRGLPKSDSETLDIAGLRTLGQSMSQVQRLAFEEAETIQAHKDQPPTSEKVQHGLITIDDRNGATCTDGAIMIDAIEVTRTMLGNGTIYECTPMGAILQT
jgi:hypothetical protein